MPWTYYERTADCLDDLGKEGLRRVAVELTDTAQSVFEYPWPSPVALVFGNEVTGISPRALKRCDDVVKIPMKGYKNSMNVATAFGVVLYEALRQWEAL